MLEPISREDTPNGLSFSLGYRVEPGSGLIFVRSSVARSTNSAHGDFQQQYRDTLNFLKRAVQSVSEDAKLVKVRRYLTTSRDERALGQGSYRNPKTRAAWQDTFGAALPASTSLQVAGSGLLGSLLDLEAWAITPSQDMISDVIRVPGRGPLPSAVAVRGDQQLCVAVAEPEPRNRFDEELLSSLDQISQRFAEQGAGPQDVLKLTVYYRDPRSWPIIEATIAGRFAGQCPVVSGVVVSNLRAPEGQVELTGWARCSARTPALPPPKSGIVDLRDRLLALTGTGALPIFSRNEANDMYGQNPPPTIEAQAHLAMANQGAVLEAAGASFADVFRSNWYLTDIRDWDVVEPIVRSYFPAELPVPMVVEVSRLTAKQGVRLEPDLWASISVQR